MIAQNDKHQHHQSGQLLTRSLQPLVACISSLFVVLICILYSLWQACSRHSYHILQALLAQLASALW